MDRLEWCKELKAKLLSFAEINTVKGIRNYLCYESKYKIRTNTVLSRSEKFLKSDLYKEVMDYTSFLPKDFDIYERMKAIIQLITEIPKCQICGKDCMRVHSKPYLFSKFCSDSCTSFYASSQNNKREESKQKISSSHKEFRKHLVELYHQVFHKFKDGNFHRYTDDEIYNFILEKKNKRNKNGTIISSKFFRDEQDMLCSIIDRTRFIPLSDELPKGEYRRSKNLQMDFKWTERIYCILNGITEYRKCKYCGADVTTFYKCPDQRYNDICPSSICEHKKIRESRVGKNLIKLRNILDEFGYDLISTENGNKRGKGRIRHRDCGYEFDYYIGNICIETKLNKNLRVLCPNCYRRENFVSQWEADIGDIIRDNTDISNIIFNDRKILNPYEIDIVVKDKRIGFECDGLYTHNDSSKGKTYHYDKTEKAENSGYSLFHLYEDEWRDRKDVVRSFVLSKISVFNRSINGQDLQSRSVSFNDSFKFMEENNILGKIRTSFNLGLYDGEELLSLLSVNTGHGRTDKKDGKYEIIRFTEKNGTDVKGSFGILMEKFVSEFNPKCLYAKIDRRVSRGDFLLKYGFEKTGRLEPSYEWVSSNFLTRVKPTEIRAGNARNVLCEYDESKSFIKNMEANGFTRIWNCGYDVYEKNLR